MSHPQMLLQLREIIQRPDISALSLVWREGSGPLVDGGAEITPTPDILRGRQTSATVSTTYVTTPSRSKGAGGSFRSVFGQQGASGSSAASSTGGTAAGGRRKAGETESSSSTTTTTNGDRGAIGGGETAADGSTATNTALGSPGKNVATKGKTTAAAPPKTGAEWTAARKGLDNDLALLYLLDESSFRALIQKHQHFLAQANAAKHHQAPIPSLWAGSDPGIAIRGGGSGGAGASGGLGSRSGSFAGHARGELCLALWLAARELCTFLRTSDSS